MDGSQHVPPSVEPNENPILVEVGKKEMSVNALLSTEDAPTSKGPAGAQETAQDHDNRFQEDAADGTEEVVVDDSQQCAQKCSPVREFQTASDESDEDMDQGSEDFADILETIEQAPGVQSEVLNTFTRDASTYGHDKECEEREDETMGNAPSESEGLSTVSGNELTEPRNEAEPMNGIQDGSDMHVRADLLGNLPQGNDNLPSAQLDDEQLEDEEATLFVSERVTPLPQPPPTLQGTSVSMAPPPRPSKTPLVAGNSLFAQIRNAQKRREEAKIASGKKATTYQYGARPNNEACLEAFMSPAKSSSPTPQPTVDQDDMAHEKADAEFRRQQQYYSNLKSKTGTLNFRQDIEWIKIMRANEARKRKRERDMAKTKEDFEDDPDLFPEARPRFDENNQDNDLDGASNFDRPAASRKRQRREIPRKVTKQMSMQQAEIQSMKVALEAIKDLPKKKRKRSAPSDDAQGAVARGKAEGMKAGAKATKSKARPRATTGGVRKTAKNKRDMDHAVKQASSLLNSNVFEQQAGAGEADQPTFRAKDKQKALKELIASVPIEDEKQARHDMAGLAAATRDFDGHGSVKAAGGNWLVKGMQTSLKGYQLLGSAFMRRRENAEEKPLGGLMADQMGLGKTLMMLANIVNGQPPKGQQPRTTLLVASPGLLMQWGKEIEQHTKCNLRVMRYGSGNRIDANRPFEILSSQDIILTTWQEVMKSYPKNEPPIECQTLEQREAWWKGVFDKQRGVLHRVAFLRVVLDEAQHIKNHTSRTSIACRALIARHRWALSGTPIMNSLTELYPYFKFLQVPHTGSFDDFKRNYCDTKDGKNTERLLLRLSQFMIRRTHSDKMFSAPILKLPQADQSTFWCDFNPVERCIYDIVQQRFTKIINTWQNEGKLGTSYSNILVMLLRLRQLTAHVLMLQVVMRDLLEVEDIERIKEVVHAEAADSNTRRGSTIIAIRKQLERHAIEEKSKGAIRTIAAARKAAGKEAEDIPEEEDGNNEDQQKGEAEVDEDNTSESTAQASARIGGSGRDFGKEYNFKPFLQSLRVGESWETAKKKAKCSWCNKQPKTSLIANPCGHFICEDICWDFAIVAAAEDGQEEPTCRACGVIPKYWLPFEDEEGPPEAVAQCTRSKAGQKSVKQREGREREVIPKDWLALAGQDVLPSAKTMAIKAQILNWTKENPKVKIIIYTQFLAMIKIMAKIFQAEGWQVEQYVGTMSLPARDKAITTFAENDNVNILLASLRSGGLGLNLTMASRVIMVDPWWNEASEQQAFCRIFRIGQKEETYMSRFCVRNTVDDRLMAMQERKRKEISEVIGDDSKRPKKTSILELMRLFGDVSEDANGKTFIIEDDMDPIGGFMADRDDEGYADDL